MPETPASRPRPPADAARHAGYAWGASHHAAVRALDLICRLEDIRPPAQTPKNREKATGDEVETHMKQPENQVQNQAG